MRDAGLSPYPPQVFAKTKDGLIVNIIVNDLLREGLGGGEGLIGGPLNFRERFGCSCCSNVADSATTDCMINIQVINFLRNFFIKIFPWQGFDQRFTLLVFCIAFMALYIRRSIYTRIGFFLVLRFFGNIAKVGSSWWGSWFGLENKIQTFVKVGEALVIDLTSSLLDWGAGRVGLKMFSFSPWWNRGQGVAAWWPLVYGKFKGRPLGFPRRHQRLSGAIEGKDTFFVIIFLAGGNRSYTEGRFVEEARW